MPTADELSDQRDAERVVRKDEGSFGAIYQLWQGNMLMDTYCSWNGDDKPWWMGLWNDASSELEKDHHDTD